LAATWVEGATTVAGASTAAGVGGVGFASERGRAVAVAGAAAGAAAAVVLDELTGALAPTGTNTIFFFGLGTCLGSIDLRRKTQPTSSVTERMRTLY
jgi:hypothetical protein